MIDRYLRDVQGARHRLAPVGSDLRSRRSRPGENRVSRRCKSERLAPVMSDRRSRRSRMAGSVNIGNIGATEDAARRRFAAVVTPTATQVKPTVAARLARDTDQSSQYS